MSSIKSAIAKHPKTFHESGKNIYLYTYWHNKVQLMGLISDFSRNENVMKLPRVEFCDFKIPIVIKEKS